jgi:general stress protein YciG
MTCHKSDLTHKHHIIPRYMGGPDTPENIVEVTVTRHAMFHFCNYQLWGNEEDRIAWRGLSGQITPDEAALEAMALGSSKSGKKHKENKTGIFARSPEEMSEHGRKSGNKHKENKTGIFGLSLEELSEAGKKGGNKNKKNKTGICGLSFEERSKNSRKVGNRSKENKTGIFGMTSEEKSEAGKKGGKIGGKISSTQKWQCTQTGYVSTAGALTRYQNARGIDTSNRIKVDGPRGWEITFEYGKVVVTYKTLKEWAKENGYSYACLCKVREGKNKQHKDIIKVVAL